MKQSEKTKVLANALNEALYWLSFAITHLDEPDDDCPSAIKKAIERLQEGVDTCES